jgi:hypothetical protein
LDDWQLPGPLSLQQSSIVRVFEVLYDIRIPGRRRIQKGLPMGQILLPRVIGKLPI